MQVNVYWNTTDGAPAVADESGVAWASATGPEGAVAVGGGGYATPYVSGQAYSAPSYPLVATKPDPEAPNSWIVGFQVPYTGAALPVTKIRCYVVCLEDLPE